MQSHPYSSLLHEAEETLALTYSQWPSYYEETIARLAAHAAEGAEVPGHLSAAERDALRAMGARLEDKKKADMAPVIGASLRPMS